jgi:hypothetical protein
MIFHPSPYAKKNPQVKLSVLPGGNGSGKIDCDGPNRKNQSAGIITSFLSLFQLKTETDRHSPGNVFFFSLK